jgi:hypothetical protein
MGIAHVSCLHGCTCTEHDLDANQKAKESTTHLHRVATTQHEECTLGVTVTRRTNSVPPEHKFKVSGVMMSDETTGSFVVHDGAWTAAQHHESMRNLLTGVAPLWTGAGAGGAAAGAAAGSK